MTNFGSIKKNLVDFGRPNKMAAHNKNYAVAKKVGIISWEHWTLHYELNEETHNFFRQEIQTTEIFHLNEIFATLSLSIVLLPMLPPNISTLTMEPHEIFHIGNGTKKNDKIRSTLFISFFFPLKMNLKWKSNWKQERKIKRCSCTYTIRCWEHKKVG